MNPSTLSSGPFSPSNSSETKAEAVEAKKRRIKSPTQDSVLIVKSEPPWDIDTVHSTENKSRIDYNIDMSAETILQLCK